MVIHVFMTPPPPNSTLFPYTTLFRSHEVPRHGRCAADCGEASVGRRLRSRREIRRRRDGPLEIELRQGSEVVRSEEHTSELQSREKLVCRLLLEKKKA